jgi:hypothetical protein
MTDHDLIVARVIAALEDEAVKAGADPAWLKAYTGPSYAAGLMEAAKAFWKEGSRGNFLTRMKALVKFGLKDAWDAGGKALGLSPEDYTPEDLAARDAIISEEQAHISDLLDYLDKLANTPGASLQQAQARLDTWANRYPDVVNRAQVIMGGDAKMLWQYGDREHCNSCLKLNGIVKRASFWKKAGVLPKSPPNSMLACGGWKCGCSLVPTDKPTRRGRLPSLP